MAATARVCSVPAVRFSSRLQLATSFIPQPSTRHSGSSGRRGGGSAAAPPAMTADVRVVIRRHFPVVGGGTRVVVADDIALRRRPTRGLRGPGRVERALAEEVLPLVAHPADRAAVAAARREICAHVAAACADARVATGGVRVLVLVDTFAVAVVLRRPRVMMMMMPCCKPTTTVANDGDEPCKGLETESGLAAAAGKEEQPRPIGVIGDGRPEPTVEKRFDGWLPW
ncbi:hypothetical protein HU200_016524 [Digitaria exilis]|uniref:Uncharacterized protein n=1 Tax=Digitaria exilis TaxID=1010633 RepID=A0A835KH56_9POAL|nr:hypothetical protein HU200_016524 [Digitaria exilis]